MVNPSSDLSSCRFILIAYLFWGDYSQLSDIHTLFGDWGQNVDGQLGRVHPPQHYSPEV